MHITLIRKESFQRAKWKNGLGYTDQVAIHPENADLRAANFLWRLSTARIEANSDFSVFPDHDRVLYVLRGAGIRLTHQFPEMEEEETVELPVGEPYEFPGDVKSRCELIDGAIQDFSVFLRKGEVGAQMTRLSVDAEGMTMEPEGRWVFFFAQKGGFTIEGDRGVVHAEEGDAIRMQSGVSAAMPAPLEGASVRLRAWGTDAEVLLIQLG